jgi:hypothetical protein
MIYLMGPMNPSTALPDVWGFLSFFFPLVPSTLATSFLIFALTFQNIPNEEVKKTKKQKTRKTQKGGA